MSADEGGAFGIAKGVVSLKGLLSHQLDGILQGHLTGRIQFLVAKGNLQRKDKMISKIIRGLTVPVIQTEICSALINREYK